ncbi:MAG: VIT1/CCC1 transporter family protein [Thaumarchaeota archaeon]|jgi:VIT1/CCC1 family predicted Fe2+/Mn2+ transporter|nr:VIT1/CCC1 transporter family protein [Candidatus Terraquivivens yellowstonensis]MCL7392710.1 VIT1/CCC1 transporter family protein [Candidatus Terraquivivens yellowstonensis]MCL7400259.1 VIT1/CCC1 transporter family protein [Candidatus Terraquivivens yellowstonensis]
MLDKEIEKVILNAQRNEITEHFIYERLARSVKDPQNREVLKRISDDELRHYNFWREYTRKDVKPDNLKVWKYFLISKIFGITFGIKLMEKDEEKAQAIYEEISEFVPDAKAIVEDEDEHESRLTNLIDEEKLRYVGSMVLGLNDALVELTGALAGYTFALQDARIVAMIGLITGVAASLSMATSEYLSTKSEGGDKNPFKASLYTGVAYILAVLFLIAPYLILTNVYACLSLTIVNAIIVIFLFTFYVSVAKGLPFRRRFLEMTVISLGIAGLTFTIGFFVRTFLNVEID